MKLQLSGNSNSINQHCGIKIQIYDFFLPLANEAKLLDQAEP